MREDEAAFAARWVLAVYEAADEDFDDGVAEVLQVLDFEQLGYVLLVDHELEIFDQLGEVALLGSI